MPRLGQFRLDKLRNQVVAVASIFDDTGHLNAARVGADGQIKF